MRARSTESAMAASEGLPIVIVVVLAATIGSAAAQRPAAPKGGAAPSAAPAGDDYARRFAGECATCHGANGRSDQAGVPVLAGQPSLYVATQLFLFREGRRDFAPMVALAKSMNDADLRGFSDAIGRLPAVAPPPPVQAPDVERMRRGAALARQHRCTFCHGADLAGGQQVPRIGGQKEDYLRRTLHGFKDGSRPAYTRAMTEALSQVPEGDLDVLAHFAANAPADGAGPAAGKP